MLSTCRQCNVLLVLGETWSEGQARNRNYLCRTCMSESGKAHYAKHAQRAAELQRARLAKPSKAREASELKSAYYAANREKWKQYRHNARQKLTTSVSHRAAKLLTWIRVRAARTGREFDLTSEWLLEKMQAGVCEVAGIRLDLGKDGDSRFNPWGPSIDRIDSARGYTQDNCRLVCWIYNMAKAEWSDEVVMTLAKALAKKEAHGNEEAKQRGGPGASRKPRNRAEA